MEFHSPAFRLHRLGFLALSENDLVVANLEGPITDNKSVSAGTAIGSANNYYFTFDPSLAPTLYKENINKAEKSIVLTTPYFMPKRWLISILHQAVLRGVKVEILVPQKTDYNIFDRINFFFIYKVAKLGVDFYVEHNMNHAKLIILDSKEAIVGSQNLDYLSFELNSEIAIFLKDINTIQKLIKITNEWKENSFIFDLKIYKPKFIDYLLYPIIRFIVKFL